jgi:hypothetical protein
MTPTLSLMLMGVITVLLALFSRFSFARTISCIKIQEGLVCLGKQLQMTTQLYGDQRQICCIYVFGLSVGAENIILSALKSCIGNSWKI